MLYFLFTANSFRKSTLDELSKITKFKVIDEHNGMFIVDAKEKNLHEKVKASIFTYCAFPLSYQGKLDKKRYLETILSAIKKTGVSKKQGLKLECIDINAKHGYSAKDIEVRTGLKLEKLHYNINIIEPEMLAYVVLLNGKWYSGYINYAKLTKKFVNPMRYYHIKKKVSRSELKIWEAFDEFRISATGTAIDLGAAPGGWSAFLAEKGLKVISIDNGDLNYKAILGEGLKIKKVDAKKGIDAQKLLETSDIIHIKSGFKQAKTALKIKDVDILTDDMNIFCSDTADAIAMYKKFLKKDAILVVTVKCLSKNVPNYIARAKNMLGKLMEIKQIKVLPSNRQEITVFARSK